MGESQRIQELDDKKNAFLNDIDKLTGIQPLENNHSTLPRNVVISHVQDLFYYEQALRQSDFFELEEETQREMAERALGRVGYFLDMLR